MEIKPKNFGQFVKQKRLEKDLTQKELAVKIGYSIHTIRAIEQNRPNYIIRPHQMITSLAQALEVTESELKSYLYKEDENVSYAVLESDASRKTRYVLLSIFSLIAIILIAIVITAFVFFREISISETPISSTLDEYLQAQKSPLMEYAYIIDQQCMIRNIDPRILVALAGAATNFGTNRQNTCMYENDLWMIGESTEPCKNYANLEEAIQDVASITQSSINANHLYNFEQLAAFLCAKKVRNCDSYINTSKSIYLELGGNLSEIHYSFTMGGLDIFKYCKDKYAPQGGDIEVFSKRFDAYSWECVIKPKLARPIRKPVNFDEVCQTQHDTLFQGDGKYSPTITAKANNPYNPFSWKCYYVNK